MQSNCLQGANKIENHPFKPFIFPSAKVLILGSFVPPAKRFAMPFYYPNLNNDFWRIMGLIFYGNKAYFLLLNNNTKTFNLPLIYAFLKQYGIAISDIAQSVIRLKNNAADKDLQIVARQPIKTYLEKMPHCTHIITTGEKATLALADLLGIEGIKGLPTIGNSTAHKLLLSNALSAVQVANDTTATSRVIALHRVPSSSRAYPLPLAQKAAAYRVVFKNCGLLTY